MQRSAQSGSKASPAPSRHHKNQPDQNRLVERAETLAADAVALSKRFICVTKERSGCGVGMRSRALLERRTEAMCRVTAMLCVLMILMGLRESAWPCPGLIRMAVLALTDHFIGFARFLLFHGAMLSEILMTWRLE